VEARESKQSLKLAGLLQRGKRCANSMKENKAI